jgi:hypothetical protein
MLKNLKKKKRKFYLFIPVNGSHSHSGYTYNVIHIDYLLFILKIFIYFATLKNYLCKILPKYFIHLPEYTVYFI